MSEKRILHAVENEPGTYLFWCPGCDEAHFFDTRWTFNGDMEKPTFRASLLVRSGNEKGPTVCHSFVTDGRIEYLGDCTHALAGQTVPMVPW